MLNPKRLQTETEELLGHRGSKQNRAVRFKDLGAGAGGGLDEKAIQKIAEKKAREVAEEYDGADVDLSEVHQRITHAEQVASGAAIEAGNASSAAANAVTHADQAVDQARADLAVDYAATIAAATDAIDARDEAVIASTGAGNSAGAAHTSSQQAGSFADEAASAAAAANQSRLDAEAARDDTDSFSSIAGIARDEAVVARQDAETAAASALVSLDMAAQVVGRGVSVLSDQFLIASDWGRYSGQGIRTLLPNQLYPIGRTWQFDVTADQTDGIQIIDSPVTIWPGQTNAAAFVIEVEYTLLSGSLQGAGVRLSWRNDTNSEFAAQFELADLQAGEGLPGRALVARGVFKRPDNFNGSFASHRLFAFANYASWAMAAKSIQFHRVNLRPATEEELGRGEVMAGVQSHLSQNYFTRTETNQAIAGADLTLNASLGPLRASVEQSSTALAGLDGTVARFTNIVTVNGEKRAGIEAVAFDGTPGGSGSVLKLIGDDVIVEKSLTSASIYTPSLLAEIAQIDQAFINDAHIAGKIRARNMEVDGLLQLIGTGSMAAYKLSPDDSSDGLFFGQAPGGFALTASRTQGQIRQEISLTPDRFRILNARHVVTGDSDNTTVAVTESHSAVDLPAGISKIKVSNLIGGGGGGVAGLVQDFIDFIPGDEDIVPVDSLEGENGSDSIIRLYDGDELMLEILSTGGKGGNQGSTQAKGGPGYDSSFGKGGAGGASVGAPDGPDSTVPGAGGGGGFAGAGWLVNTNRLLDNFTGGWGGYASENRSHDWVDLSRWGNPRIEVIVGGGGLGGEYTGPLEMRVPETGDLYSRATGVASYWRSRAAVNEVYIKGKLIATWTDAAQAPRQVNNYLTLFRGEFVEASGNDNFYGINYIARQRQSGKGGRGGPGLVEYEYTDAVEIPADVVPLVPTVSGTFTASASTVLPNLGAGLWILYATAGANNLGLGFWEVSPGEEIRIHNVQTVSFFASQTPRYLRGAESTRAAAYLFYKMGSWG